MADYTILLKTLLDDPNSKALIDKALSTYPLYNSVNEDKFTKVMTREELNQKLLNHFKYREIGFETFGRFLDELEIAMNEIMPYYNQFFISEDIINGLDDIFGNLDVSETYEETTSTSGTSSGNDSVSSSESASEDTETNTNTSDNSTIETDMTTNTKNVSSETPQSIIDNAETIDNVSHADKIDFNKADSNSTTENKGTTTSSSTGKNTSSKETSVESSRSGTDNRTGTTSHTLTRKGNQGVNTYAHDMLEFRKLFLNVVEMIIKDRRIQDLFFGIY